MHFYLNQCSAVGERETIELTSLISDVMSMTHYAKVKRGEVAKLTSFSEMLHLHTENTARVVKVEGPSGRLSVSCSPSFTSFPAKLQKSFSFLSLLL